MGLLGRVRKRFSALGANALAAAGEQLQLHAELPAGRHGSVFKFDLSLRSEEHGDGERVHLRAHLQSNFASVLRPMIEAGARGQTPAIEADAGPGRALAPRRVIGQLAARGAQRMLANPAFRRLADPLLHRDTQSYVEVVSSSASLDGGAFELMPRNEKLSALGIRPTRHAGPHIETWSGVLADGNAQVATLQLDKDSLPESLRRQLGDAPFNLAAMIVSTVQEK